MPARTLDKWLQVKLKLLGQQTMSTWKSKNLMRILFIIQNPPLRDYNEDSRDDEDPIPALKKSTSGKEAVSPADRETKKLALREKLAHNGFALRTMLMDEQIQAHYVSPMSTEDEMSVEDMLAEIPKEDLQSVAIVQGHIYMPLPFARKY